jgi:hypothetical protein
MGFLLLSEQNTMKLLLNSYMSYFTNSLITNISISNCVLWCHQFRLDGHSKCCLALLSDAVVPDLVVRRSIAVDLYGQKLTYIPKLIWYCVVTKRDKALTTCIHTIYQYVQIPLFHITHLEYSSYTQTLFMGFLLLSEQNTLKRLLNFHMSYFTNSLITNISISDYCS